MLAAGERVNLEYETSLELAEELVPPRCAPQRSSDRGAQPQRATATAMEMSSLHSPSSPLLSHHSPCTPSASPPPWPSSAPSFRSTCGIVTLARLSFCSN